MADHTAEETNMLKSVLLLICMLNLVFASPAWSLFRQKPVYNPTLAIQGELTSAQIESVIRQALIKQKWSIQSMHPGSIHARLRVRSHTADIQVAYDDKFIHIRYLSSTNLLHKEENGTQYVHRAYNNWVKKAETHIAKALSAAESQSPRVATAPAPVQPMVAAANPCSLAPSHSPPSPAASASERHGAYRLTIHATPRDSAIKIMNIKPKYYPGITLPPGRYWLRIESPGYIAKDEWITLRHQDMHHQVVLSTLPTSYRLTVHALPHDSVIEFVDRPFAYQPGMALAPGQYDILVTRHGFRPVQRTLFVEAADLTINVELDPNSPVLARPTPADPTDVIPPILTIISHNTEQTTTISSDVSRLKIWGHATDPNGVTEVLVNGSETTLDANGRFTSEVALGFGHNSIIITAMDTHQNIARQTVTIHRPQGPPTTASVAAVVSTAPAVGNYHALVIGNNQYQHLSSLQTAVNDATKLANTLRSDYGFEVTLLTDVGREQIVSSLDRLRAQLTPADNLLIYYAGHGYLDKETGRGYWLPVDARRETQAQWIANTTLSDTLKGMKAKHVMVVADSCYAGALVRAVSVVALPSGPSRAQHLAQLAQKRSRTALVSGGLEPVEDGFGGDHSVFAKALLDALKDNRGTIEGERLFMQIQRPVMLEANQTPQYSDIRFTGHDGGDFLFVRK
jgi:hypothetical protein